MNITSFLPSWLYEQLGTIIKERPKKAKTNFSTPEKLKEEIDNWFEFDVLIAHIDSSEQIFAILNQKTTLSKKHLILLVPPNFKGHKKELRRIFEATQIDFIDLLEEEKYSLGEEEILQFTSAINNLTLSL